jgi:hypothetical protein
MPSRAKNPLLERRSRSPTGAAWAEDGVGCVILVSPVLCSSAHRRPTSLSSLDFGAVPSIAWCHTQRR